MCRAPVSLCSRGTGFSGAGDTMVPLSPGVTVTHGRYRVASAAVHNPFARERAA